MTDCYGAITWWGFSPCLDLQDQDILTSLSSLHLEETEDSLNILLVGAGDVRHILTTVARSYRHKKRKLHFYVLENTLELYARDMLFLTLALEPQNRLGLQEKTEMFLELFGNILVRQQSCEYVEKMASEFIKMVTDFDYLEKKLPIFDLSQLKFKERDFLEGIFKFWRNPERNIFEVDKYWDLRLRKHLGVRYDNRMNIYDWDYHMRFTQRDADVINSHEYKRWRNSGVAFEVREASYEAPNKTLASGLLIKHEGEKFARRGYWGDIVVSPYISLGIECEEKSFFKKSNGVYVKTAQCIAEYNMLSLFHELASRERYVLPKVEDVKTEEPPKAKLEEITEEEEEAAEKEEETKAAPSLEELQQELAEDVQTSESVKNNPLNGEFEALPVDDVKITFLPLNSLPDLPKKNKYSELFHVVFFSNSMVHLLKPEVTPILAENATVILETAKYMVEVKIETVKEFVGKVTGIARAAGCKVVGPVDDEKDVFLKFQYEKLSR